MLAAVIGAGASLASSILGNRSAEKQAEKNIKYQKDFAQKGIQWRTQDAKKAGIHPLAALGAQTHSFAPVSVGHDYSGLAQAGQDIGRAIDATRNSGERVDAYTKTVHQLQLQRMGLENELLASQIAKVRGAGHPPASPSPTNLGMIPGQGDVKTQPHKVTASHPNDPSREAGAITDTGHAWTGTGWAPVMSDDFKQRSEEDPWAVLGHWVRNRVPQTFQYKPSFKPPFQALSDEYWAYHPYAQEYRLFRRKGSGTHSRFRFRN